MHYWTSIDKIKNKDINKKYCDPRGNSCQYKEQSCLYKCRICGQDVKKCNCKVKIQFKTLVLNLVSKWWFPLRLKTTKVKLLLTQEWTTPKRKLL